MTVWVSLLNNVVVADEGDPRRKDTHHPSRHALV
jgi:hypothetical protein